MLDNKQALDLASLRLLVEKLVTVGITIPGEVEIKNDSNNPIPTTLPSGAMALVSSTVTDDNTIAAGARAVHLETSNDYSGAIDGATAYASADYAFVAETGKTLPAITYTTTTGSITIRKLT